ncbi:MAG TPA: hypothetical protein VGM01_14000 [Ktedonobacteraceae bacterium]|jgi:hypothetical protein
MATTRPPEDVCVAHSSIYPRPRVVGARVEVPLFDGKRVRYYVAHLGDFR